MLKYRKKILLAAIETSYGTAASLAAANTVLASNIEITPLAGETVSRELQYAYYGASPEIPVNTHQTLAFRVELAGSGTAEKPPAWGVLLRGCGMAETITSSGSKKVEYTPVSSGESALTLALNIDGQQHQLKGARGTFTLEVNPSQIPYLNFTFTGLWATPSSAAAITPSYTAWKDPLTASKANTPTAQIHSQDVAVSAFSCDWGAEVTHREVIGAVSQVLITDRATSGSMTIDAPTLSTKNFFTLAKAGTTGALKIVHGSAAGSIVEIDAPKVQLSSPSYQEASGIAQLQLALRMMPNSGNDEFIVTTK